MCPHRLFCDWICGNSRWDVGSDRRSIPIVLLSKFEQLRLQLLDAIILDIVIYYSDIELCSFDVLLVEMVDTLMNNRDYSRL